MEIDEATTYTLSALTFDEKTIARGLVRSEQFRKESGSVSQLLNTKHKAVTKALPWHTLTNNPRYGYEHPLSTLYAIWLMSGAKLVGRISRREISASTVTL